MDATDFPLLLCDKKRCLATLYKIRGGWTDCNWPKHYFLTPKQEYANVLTDHDRSGIVQRGVNLVAVKKVSLDMYCILWGDKFCLSADTTTKSLTWLPINPRGRTFKWKRWVHAVICSKTIAVAQSKQNQIRHVLCFVYEALEHMKRNFVHIQLNKTV